MSEIRSIIVKDYLHHFEEGTVGTIALDKKNLMPGDIVQTTDGVTYSAVKNDGDMATFTGIVLPSIGGSVNEEFKEGDKITVWIPQKGDIGYVLVDEGTYSVGGVLLWDGTNTTFITASGSVINLFKGWGFITEKEVTIGAGLTGFVKVVFTGLR